MPASESESIEFNQHTSTTSNSAHNEAVLKESDACLRRTREVGHSGAATRRIDSLLMGLETPDTSIVFFLFFVRLIMFFLFFLKKINLDLNVDVNDNVRHDSYAYRKSPSVSPSRIKRQTKQKQTNNENENDNNNNNNNNNNSNDDEDDNGDEDSLGADVVRRLRGKENDIGN